MKTKRNKIFSILIVFICLMSVSVLGQNQCPPPGGPNGGGLGFPNPNKPFPPTNGDSIHVPVQRAFDPNEIIGMSGYDSLKWVKVSDQLAYTIYFENSPDFATASAQRVEVRYAFHDNANIYSLGLGSFGFGSFIFTVEGYPSVYQKRLDVRDSLGIYVDVVAGLDVVKKEAFWIFKSIDPVTGLPPLAVNSGFLPVNDKTKHNGEGFVSFAMKPRSTCQTRDTIAAEASIIFDTNEAILTNVWVNTLDAVAPVSSLIAIVDATENAKYHFSFDAEDDLNGSGVKRVALYLSKNREAYTEYAVCKPDSEFTFITETGTEYAFYTLSEDNTSNIEGPKTVSDIVLNTNVAPTGLSLSDTLFTDDIAVGGFIGELSTVDSEPGQTYTYALTEGEGAIHNDLFLVSANSLITNSSFKCAADTIYKIRLSTTDVGGLSYEKSFILKLKRVLEQPAPDTLTATICEGESYLFHGDNYTQTGIFQFLKGNEYTCDSIYILDLRVNPYPAQPRVTVEGDATLVSSALTGNQWYTVDSLIIGATLQSYTPVHTGKYYVTVSNGSCESVPSDTYFVNRSDTLELSWIFSQGWNWISSNLNDNNLQVPKQFLNPIHGHVEKILGQKSELVNDPVYGLTGGLNRLEPEVSYKLKMKQTDTLTLSGVPFPADSILIQFKKGWNWVGYIPKVKLSTKNALSNLAATTNDVIKGLSAFSIFDGSNWVGTLDHLSPGEGYMYYSASATEFTYPSVIATPYFNSSLKSVTVSVNRWEMDERKYPNNMNIVARLYKNSAAVEPGIYSIGAFAGDECRGIGKYVDGLLFITIHGAKSGEVISFKALENATGEELKVKESTGFGEMVLGNPKQPYNLNLTVDVTGVEDHELFITVYPNPVKERLYIGGDIPALRGIRILSMTGSIVISTDGFSSANGLDVSTLTSGAYLIALSTEKGTIYRKFIKSVDSDK